MKRRGPTLVVKESSEEIKNLLHKESRLGERKRLLFLICYVEKKIIGYNNISNHLGVPQSTISNWVREYKNGGIAHLIRSKSQNRVIKSIPSEIQKALKEEVNNPHGSLSGYKDAQQWISKKFNDHIPYTTLRHYLIREYGTKIKTPRKSHFKKDDQAEEAFKKTT